MSGVNSDTMKRQINHDVTGVPRDCKTGITYDGDTFVVVDNEGTVCPCRGISVKPGGAAGIVEVHLIGSPVGVWTLKNVDDQLIQGMAVDLIRTTNTTVATADIQVWF